MNEIWKRMNPQWFTKDWYVYKGSTLVDTVRTTTAATARSISASRTAHRLEDLQAFSTVQ
jgi:hypothetical protein